jgi:hypothetical protein
MVPVPAPQVRTLCLYFLGLACLTLVAHYVEVAFFMITGVRQANRIRVK